VSSKIEFVLDASALLALIFGEPGETFVHSVLNRSGISAVNYSEVLSKLIQKGAPPEAAARQLRDLSLMVVPFDEPLAREGADLAPLAWRHGLSFADRACLTLARHVKAPAVTADQRWRIAGLRVEVRLLR